MWHNYNVGPKIKMKTTIIAISIILVSSIANAVCIDGHPSIKDEYAKSQRIIIGKIIDEALKQPNAALLPKLNTWLADFF